MVDKQQLRPPNPLPNWANDDSIDDPGEPWDGNPTKVEPGTGKRDDGFLPEEKPSAQHFSQLFHEIGLWLQWISDIQVLNWFGNIAAEEPAGALNTCEAVTYDEGGQVWIVAGRADVVDLSPDGQFWTETATGHAGTSTFAVTKDPFEGVTTPNGRSLVGAGGPLFNDDITEFDGGPATFATQTLPGSTGTIQAEWAVYDTFNDLWIVVGAEDGAPAIWTDVTPIAGFTQRAAAASGSSSIEMVATNPNTGFSVAIGNTLEPLDVWTSSDGVAWARSTATGLTGSEFAHSIAYDPDRDLFILAGQDDFYTSAGNDGVAWSQVYAVPPGGAAFQKRCLLVIGSMYIAAAETGPPVIRYSGDGGSSWREVAIGVGDETALPIHAMAYSKSRGQIMVTWADNPNRGFVSISLAVGTSRRNVQGTFLPYLQPPTL